MPDCRVCNAPIFWAEGPDGKIPLDEHEQRDYGPDRYRILANSTPPKVEPVAEESPGRLYVDHRTLCQQPRAM